jgi:hypothetical protein
VAVNGRYRLYYRHQTPLHPPLLHHWDTCTILHCCLGCRDLQQITGHYQCTSNTICHLADVIELLS